MFTQICDVNNCAQVSSGTPLDLRQRREEQEHPRHRVRAAAEELCQVQVEAGLPRHHRHPADAAHGAQQRGRLIAPAGRPPWATVGLCPHPTTPPAHHSMTLNLNSHRGSYPTRREFLRLRIPNHVTFTLYPFDCCNAKFIYEIIKGLSNKS